MYNFIHCEQQLKRFYQQILPPLEKDEVIVLFLKARKKYAPELSSNNKLLQRKIITDYKSFIPLLKQFNCQMGSYQDNDQRNIPQHACVLYCTINPCSTLIAAKNLISLCNEHFFTLIKNPDEWQNIKKLHNTTGSEIQKSRSRKCYTDIDFDIVDKEYGKRYVQSFLDEIGDVNHHIIETRGGYHILLEKDSLTPKVGHIMYQTVRNLDLKGKKELGDKFEVIINSQTTIPVPGTNQGGFAVRIVDSLGC